MKRIVFVLVIVSSLLALTMGCSTSQSSGSKSNVTFRNTRWGLLSLNGKKVDKPQSGKEIYVIFKQNETFFEGFAGCNGIRGQYVANIDGTMNISGIISTMMACDVMETESGFTQALESATTYKIVGDELILYTNGKETAKLYAVYLR